MNASKPPPVVAELGRAETPAESAERKALSSRQHRERQTPVNLIAALVASLLAVLVLVLVVVRPELPPRPAVDFATIASEAGSTTALAAPELPSGWKANAATFDARPMDGVVNWYVGFVTPSHQFAALRQGIDANPTWVANQLAGARSTGSKTIDGVVWTVYDRRDVKDPGNLAFAMSTEGRDSSYVLFGTAPNSEFDVLAAALVPTITNLD